jgi:hypothetical protein
MMRFLSALALSLVLASAAWAQGTSVQGLWRGGDTTIRITVSGTEAKGLFVEIGPAASALGFKAGEVSFVATTIENFLYGVQTVRYGKCHPNGRKVPVIGRLTADGQTLAIHNYLITVDPNCRDTGEYILQQSLWQRVPGR